MRMTNGSEIDNLMEMIAKNNPWHDPKNKDWFLSDGSLREVIIAENQGLFEPPKIFFYLDKDFFRRLFSEPEKHGILIIRGPRRIGKTSTLKYLIKTMIDSGYPAECFVYLSLDADELLAELDRKRILRELVDAIITRFRKPGKPLILILDEVTFYKGWARAIKNLVDSGSIGPGIGIINTGSYSLDLSSAKTELSGRFGPLGENMGGDLFFFPRRFIEVSESVLGSSFKSFFARNLGKFGKRMGMIEYLAGYQTSANDASYNYDNLLESFIKNHYTDLHTLFINTYIYTGGYPKSIFEAVTTQRQGETSVSDARYRDDIYNLILTDSKKFDLDETIIRGILSNMPLPSMRISGNYDSIVPKNLTPKKDQIERCIEYLEASGLFNFLPNISSPDQVNIEQQIVSPSRDKLKLVISDPSVFIASYLCSRGTSSIFRAAKGLLANDIIMEHLAESIVVSHLQHAPVLKRSMLSKNVGYMLLDQDGKEKEIVDGMAWYINFKNKFIVLPVEVKYGNNPSMREIKEKAEILKEQFKIPRLIVVTNSEKFEIQENYTMIPIEIFLSLL